MFAHPGGFEISRRHALMLAAASQNDTVADRAQAERAEAFAWRCASTAEEVREQHDAAVAAEIARQQQLEQARLAAAAERQARAQDYRDMLLATGQGRWRTVSEILAAAAGRP